LIPYLELPINFKFTVSLISQLFSPHSLIFSHFRIFLITIAPLLFICLLIPILSLIAPSLTPIILSFASPLLSIYPPNLSFSSSILPTPKLIFTFLPLFYLTPIPFLPIT